MRENGEKEESDCKMRIKEREEEERET